MARWRGDRTDIYWIEGAPPSRGLRLRGYASALIAVGWLAFFVLWLFFAADGLSIYRNLAIIFLSLVVAAALMGVLWVSYGLGIGMRYAPGMLERYEFREMRARTAASIAIWGAWAALVISWLYFFADSLSGYQNAAVLVLSLIAAALATSLLWRRYMGSW
jgi:hypothetical protein